MKQIKLSTQEYTLGKTQRYYPVYPTATARVSIRNPLYVPFIFGTTSSKTVKKIATIPTASYSYTTVKQTLDIESISKPSTIASLTNITKRGPAVASAVATVEKTHYHMPSYKDITKTMFPLFFSEEEKKKKKRREPLLPSIPIPPLLFYEERKRRKKPVFEPVHEVYQFREFDVGSIYKDIGKVRIKL